MGGMGGEEFAPVIREEKAKRNQYNTLKKSERARAGVLSVRCVQVIRDKERGYFKSTIHNWPHCAGLSVPPIARFKKSTCRIENKSVKSN